MSVLIFPRNLQVFQSIGWGFNITASKGGTPLIPLPPVTTFMSGGPWWICNMGSLVISELKRKHYNQWEGLMDGGSVPVILPKTDADIDQPWVQDSDRILSRNQGLTHSDGSHFSDGSGYRPSYINISLVSDLALRQAVFSVNLNRCAAGGLVGGEHFTIEHPTWGSRLYRVIRAYKPVSSVQQIEVRPTIREAAPAISTTLDFDRPRCTMRLDMDKGMVAQFDISRNARPSLNFVEFGTTVN